MRSRSGLRLADESAHHSSQLGRQSRAIWSAAFGLAVVLSRGPLLTWSATRPTVAPLRASVLAADGEERAHRSPRENPRHPYATSITSILTSNDRRDGAGAEGAGGLCLGDV